MDLRQLRYFVKIVELESISLAAEALHVAQPSLSQHVVNLESELGTKLLNRSNHGTKPTHEGEMLFRYAKSILRQVEEAQTSIRTGGQIPAGHISLGLPPSTMRVIGFEVLRRVRQLLPEISLEIHEGSTSDLIDKLCRQQMDLCIVPDPQAHAAFDSTPLIDEELLAVGPISPSPSGGSLPLSSVTEHPLILPPMPNSVRAKLEKACMTEGLTYRLVGESSVVSLMTACATSGFAWSILPWGAIVEARDALQAYTINNVFMTRRLYLCSSKSATASAATRAVSAQIQSIAREFIEKGVWMHATFVP